MKLFIRTLVFSLATLTIGTHVHAMETFTLQRNSFDFAEQITGWHKNHMDSKLKQFCINNPIFKWIENNLEIKKWDDQNIGNFWTKIKESIWKNNQHRINGFIEIICFLNERIEKESALDSPKEDRKKLHEELEDMKKEPELHPQYHYNYYETLIAQNNQIIDTSTDAEITYLKSDISNYWETMIKRAFRMNINFQSKDVLAEIFMHAKQILDSIFMYDPTFKK